MSPFSRPITDVRRPAAPLGLATLLLLLAAPRLLAQGEGVLRGRVLSERDTLPVPQATLTARGARGARTDAAGRFVLPLPAGTQFVTVRALGYQSTTREFRIGAGETTLVTIVLEAVPVRLEAVRSTARAPEREQFERAPDVGSFTLSGATVRNVPPVGEPDVLRSVQLLPGITSRSDYTAGYNVRGGESDQNLVLLDGIPVYNPFHFGGLFGTFMDETVAEVNMLTGGFPASFGGRLSSVLDVTTVDEARQGVHGAATVSLLSSSAGVGGMLPNARTSWNVALRRTYADKLAPLFSSDDLPYHFWDGQLKLRHLVKDGGQLSLTAYAGRDVLDGSFAQFEDQPRDAGDFRFDWGNALVGAAYVQPLPSGSRIPTGVNSAGILLGDSARLELRSSLTTFSTGLDLGDGALTLTNRVDELRTSGALTWFLGAHARRLGAEVSRHRVRYFAESEDTGIPLFSLSQRPWAGSVFWDDTWRMSSRWLTRWGVRAEHVTKVNWTGVSPRVSVKFFASPDLAFTVAGGRYTQWMHALRDEDTPVRIFDAWVASDEFTPVSIADHAVLGGERWFGDARFVRVEGWGKRYERVTELNPADDPRVEGDDFLFLDGVSYGADVLLRQVESGRFGGWIAYGYAVSMRESLDGTRYAPAQDRRHNVNAVATWRLPSRWQLAARLGYGSGTPFTDIEGQIVRRVYNGADGKWDSGITDRDIEPVGGVRNGTRYPYFARFDVTASRRFDWRGVSWEPYASIINATNRRNVFVYTFDYTDNPPTRTAFSQFPILPTIGLTARF